MAVGVGSWVRIECRTGAGPSSGLSGCGKWWIIGVHNFRPDQRCFGGRWRGDGRWFRRGSGRV